MNVTRLYEEKIYKHIDQFRKVAKGSELPLTRHPAITKAYNNKFQIDEPFKKREKSIFLRQRLKAGSDVSDRCDTDNEFQA